MYKRYSVDLRLTSTLSFLVMPVYCQILITCTCTNVCAWSYIADCHNVFSDTPKCACACGTHQTCTMYMMMLTTHDVYLYTCIAWDISCCALIPSRCLWFFLEPIAVRGDNYAFLRKLLETIKMTVDAQNPTNSEANKNIYAACDLAMGVMMSKVLLENAVVYVYVEGLCLFISLCVCVCCVSIVSLYRWPIPSLGVLMGM